MPVHRWASCLNDITDFDGRSTAQEADSIGPVPFGGFPQEIAQGPYEATVSDGEMVFSSTKTTPPCFRSSSAQALSNGGIVLRSYVTNVHPCMAACGRQAESCLSEEFSLFPFRHITNFMSRLRL